MSSAFQIAMKDMGQFIELAKSKQKYLPGPILNVTGFGVKGDGVTDDTEALQDLLDQAILDGQKAIFFPHTESGGEYYVTALTNADQVVFFGDNASFIGGYSGTINQFGDWASTAQVADIAINVKAFGAKGDGVTDDTAAIQSAIDYVQNYGSDAEVFSDGTNNTRFGGKVLIPSGKYKITSPLIINAVAAQGAGDSTISYAGVTIIGSGLDCTVIDATAMVSGSPITINGSHVFVSDIQILNSPEHGIKVNGPWKFEFKKVYVNKAAVDGIYFSKGFMITISQCLVYEAGGYGFSFNDYHTSCHVENNYALHCALGGYFVGDRVDMNLSKGMTYSHFSGNACDATAKAYTFARCRTVDVSGCGCEDVSSRAIYIYGTNCNLTIHGFFAHMVDSYAVEISGNNCNVSISNFVDSSPTDASIPLITGGGTDTSVIISGFTLARTYLYDATALLNVIRKDVKKVKSVVYDVQGKTIASLKHPSRYTANYSGMIIVKSVFGGSTDPNSAINTATYYLLIDKGLGGSNITTIASAGLKGDTTASLSWPSFDFTFTGDDLIATHTTSSAWSSRTFSFILETTGDLFVT